MRRLRGGDFHLKHEQDDSGLVLVKPKPGKCLCGKRPFFGGKVRAKVNGFERVIAFKPGYLCERWEANPQDPGSHGRHGSEVLFLLVGKAGVVQFLIYTGWHVSRDPLPQSQWRSMAADLGYHSRKPHYDGQGARTDCPWLPKGTKCYYDGSGLNAEEPWKLLRDEGEEAMWSYLEDYYRGVFA